LPSPKFLVICYTKASFRLYSPIQSSFIKGLRKIHLTGWDWGSVGDLLEKGSIYAPFQAHSPL